MPQYLGPENFIADIPAFLSIGPTSHGNERDPVHLCVDCAAAEGVGKRSMLARIAPRPLSSDAFMFP